MHRIIQKISMMALIAGFCIWGAASLAAGEGPTAGPGAFTMLEGTWVRPDGGYVLQVGEIGEGGDVAAKYFNPAPIHVDEARASVEKNLVKLYVKLRGKGYPGSTYTLYYYKEKDALAGFYYQAAMNRKFEVIFLRRK